MRIEMSDIAKLLPKGARLVFDGRVSRRDAECVGLYLPLDYVKQFSQKMRVKVWGSTLYESWGILHEDYRVSEGVSYEDNERMSEKLISPPEGGGSILLDVYERLREGFADAAAALAADRGYKAIEIEG